MTTFAEYLSYIVTSIVGYFTVWVITKLKKRVLNKRLILFEKESKKIDCSDLGFTPIATNYRLKRNFFRAEALQKYYSITIPKDSVSELQKLNFLEVKLSDDNELEDYDYKILKAFNYCDTLSGGEIIKQESVYVANSFICDIEQGKLRFNKYLYGVSDVVKEKDLCKLFLYESDYFTYKVTVRLFNLLRQKQKYYQQHCNYGYNNISELTPFLNSIGVGGFIILNRGFGDELVFGFRSKVSCQSGGYWHFSFDETFTHDDKTSENGMPNMEGCMLRAIEEELGLSEEERKICGVRDNVRLLNAGIISTTGDDNRFEFEVCGFGYIKFSKKYTFEDFCLGYRFAKDAEIETQTLDFVNINKDLDLFLETAKKQNEISPEAYNLAKNIKLLYDLKILGDSYWQ